MAVSYSLKDDNSKPQNLPLYMTGNLTADNWRDYVASAAGSPMAEVYSAALSKQGPDGKSLQQASDDLRQKIADINKTISPYDKQYFDASKEASSLARQFAFFSLGGKSNDWRDLIWKDGQKSSPNFIGNRPQSKDIFDPKYVQMIIETTANDKRWKTPEGAAKINQLAAAGIALDQFGSSASGYRATTGSATQGLLSLDQYNKLSSELLSSQNGGIVLDNTIKQAVTDAESGYKQVQAQGSQIASQTRKQKHLPLTGVFGIPDPGVGLQIPGGI